MLDQALVGRIEAAYHVQQTVLAQKLDARLLKASGPARAVRSAAKSVKKRCELARRIIGEALEAERGAVASATELATLFDRLVGGERASCVNATAAVAGRWPDPNATMVATAAAVEHAYEREREDVLRHLQEDASESQHRQRPWPMRLARNGVNALFGGGLLWRGWLFVSQHWSQIAAHLHH
jgi:hypothetical protein